MVREMAGRHAVPVHLAQQDHDGDGEPAGRHHDAGAGRVARRGRRHRGGADAGRDRGLAGAGPRGYREPSRYTCALSRARNAFRRVRDAHPPHAHEFAPARPHRRRHPARRRRHRLQRVAGTAHPAPHQRRLPARPTIRRLRSVAGNRGSSRRCAPRRTSPTPRSRAFVATEADVDADDRRAGDRCRDDDSTGRLRSKSSSTSRCDATPRRCRPRRHRARARTRPMRQPAAGSATSNASSSCSRPRRCGAARSRRDCTRGSASGCAGSAAARRDRRGSCCIRPRRASSSSSPPACCWPTATAPRATRSSTPSSASMSELAPTLPAALSVPDVAAETDRAEALDRLCADVDVQIGLTVLKPEPREHRGHAAARRRRGGRLPAGRRRPLRMAAGGDRRRALHAAERPQRTVHRRHAARVVDQRRRASSSTCRASPTRCARSTR